MKTQKLKLQNKNAIEKLKIENRIVKLESEMEADKAKGFRQDYINIFYGLEIKMLKEELKQQ